MDFSITRVLQFEIRGKYSTGKLYIGGLRRDSEEEDGFWACDWSLDEIHPKVGKINGIDGLDALLNCVLFVTNLIQRHASIGYEIWWHEKGDMAGLSLLQLDEE